MSTNKINVVINGSELSIENPSSEQLSAIINALSRDDKKPAPVIKTTKKPDLKEVRSRARAAVSSFQYENKPVAIGAGFNLDKALSLDLLSYSFDSGGQLKDESKQVKARKEIVWIFASSGNNPLVVNDICEPLIKSLSLSSPAASNYISQCARLGVLAKNQNDNTYHLSKWFIEQVML